MTKKQTSASDALYDAIWAIAARIREIAAHAPGHATYEGGSTGGDITRELRGIADDLERLAGATAENVEDEE